MNEIKEDAFFVSFKEIRCETNKIKDQCNPKGTCRMNSKDLFLCSKCFNDTFKIREQGNE
jgi:hypothetical protein